MWTGSFAATAGALLLGGGAPLAAAGQAQLGDQGTEAVAAGPEARALVAGGLEAEIERYPYAMSITYPMSITSVASARGCGGALIHPRVVLTSARCLDMYGVPATVDVGHDVFDTLAVEQYVAHPRWRKNWSVFFLADPDFALLLLATPSTKTPVRLAQNEDDAPVGETAALLGWFGAPFEAVNTVIAADTCGSWGRPPPDNVLCGQQINRLKSGDGGSPLIIKDAGEDAAEDVLVGMYSYGRSAYAKVSWASDWIEETLQDWGIAAVTGTVTLDNFDLSADVELEEFVGSYQASLAQAQAVAGYYTKVTVTKIETDEGVVVWQPQSTSRSLAQLQLSRLACRIRVSSRWSYFPWIRRRLARESAEDPEELRLELGNAAADLEGIREALDSTELDQWAFGVAEAQAASSVLVTGTYTVSGLKLPADYEGRFFPAFERALSEILEDVDDIEVIAGETHGFRSIMMEGEGGAEDVVVWPNSGVRPPGARTYHLSWWVLPRSSLSSSSITFPAFEEHLRGQLVASLQDSAGVTGALEGELDQSVYGDFTVTNIMIDARVSDGTDDSLVLASTPRA